MRTVSNKKYMMSMSLNGVFNISSSCLSGNNHALPQYPPNPVNFLSIRRVYFHSNAPNQLAKPPCLILMWVPILPPTECACADWLRNACVISKHARLFTDSVERFYAMEFTLVCDNREITSQTRNASVK